MFAFSTSDLLGLIRVDYPSGPRLRLRFFVAAALSSDLRFDPCGRRRTHPSPGAWRKEAVPSVGIVGIGIPISHLLHRQRWGEVLGKYWIPTETSDGSAR